MKLNYRPDKTFVHLCYHFEAQRVNVNASCIDKLSGKVHTREDFENMVRMLKKLGFKVKASRDTNTTVISEKFPTEELED